MQQEHTEIVQQQLKFIVERPLLYGLQISHAYTRLVKDLNYPPPAHWPMIWVPSLFKGIGWGPLFEFKSDLSVKCLGTCLFASLDERGWSS